MYLVYRKHLLYCLAPIIPDAFKGTVLGQNRLCCSNQETHISMFYQNNHLLSPQFRLFILLFAIMKVHRQLFYHEEALPASVFRSILQMPVLQIHHLKYIRDFQVHIRTRRGMSRTMSQGDSGH